MDVRTFLLPLLAPPLLACGLACSGKGTLHPVRGKVLVDGKAAEGAVVVFHPKGGDPLEAQRPSGVAGADGTFTLSTGTKAGAPAGEYTVTIEWPGDPPAKPTGKALSTDLEEPERPDRLGGRYANAATSTLQATVRSGSNQLPPFEIR